MRSGLRTQEHPEAVRTSPFPHFPIPSFPLYITHSRRILAANPPPGASFSVILSADVTVRRSFT